jgi:anti-anti-sigma factor
LAPDEPLGNSTVDGNMLAVRGELGSGSEDAFRQALEELLAAGGDERYVIDLSEVRYVSSGYVGPIAQALVEARRKGRPVTVIARRKAAHLMRLSGLDKLAEVQIADC